MKGRFWGNALAGACIAIFANIFLCANLAAIFGSTYSARCAIYASFLLWTIAGGATIVMKTWKGERSSLSLRFIAIWCLSVWLWPLLLLSLKKK